jgi:multiple sugar transport system substrate-binding protein
MQAVASGRPDMLMMGDNAAKDGFVPNGGTSAEALGVYTNMAENFTGYWNGTIDRSTAIKKVSEYMTGVFKK